MTSRFRDEKRRDKRRVVSALTLAGFRAFDDAFDDGLLRIYTTSLPFSIDPGKLVGLVVIRHGKVTYAELYGRVHHFGAAIEHDVAMRLLIEQIHGGPQ